MLSTEPPCGGVQMPEGRTLSMTRHLRHLKMAPRRWNRHRSTPLTTTSQNRPNKVGQWRTAATPGALKSAATSNFERRAARQRRRFLKNSIHPSASIARRWFSFGRFGWMTADVYDAVLGISRHLWRAATKKKKKLEAADEMTARPKSTADRIIWLWLFRPDDRIDSQRFNCAEQFHRLVSCFDEKWMKNAKSIHKPRVLSSLLPLIPSAPLHCAISRFLQSHPEGHSFRPVVELHNLHKMTFLEHLNEFAENLG